MWSGDDSCSNVWDVSGAIPALPVPGESPMTDQRTEDGNFVDQTGLGSWLQKLKRQNHGKTLESPAGRIETIDQGPGSQSDECSRGGGHEGEELADKKAKECMGPISRINKW